MVSWNERTTERVAGALLGVLLGACAGGKHDGADPSAPPPVAAPLPIAATSATRVAPSAPPLLEPGVWKDLSPPGLDYARGGYDGAQSYGIVSVAFARSAPDVLYLAVDQMGVWKSTDRGARWRRLGDPNRHPENKVVYYLEHATLAVDPGNSEHLYATQGVRGGQQGFWTSNDGGESWRKPRGAIVGATHDLTTLVVDPTDFQHVLVGSHSPWEGRTNAGILETKDGGDSWVLHAPQPTWPAGTVAIGMLFSPEHHLGNGQTWLVGTDGDGMWRTVDAGAHWTKVTAGGVSHGGAAFYYGRDGALYMGGTPYPRRSVDNGVSLEDLKDGLPWAFYYCVMGDGHRLYTQLSFTGDNAGRGRQPYATSLESDGVHWSPYRRGAQTFDDGPLVMAFDPANRILYSANWRAGLWALEVTGD